METNMRLLTSFFLTFAAFLSTPLAEAIDLRETVVGQPYTTKTQGYTMFRGNPTRTFYGSGSLPKTKPRQLWRYPDKPMCSSATARGETKTWCGSGWTGQPVVWERPDGVTEVIIGTYDRSVHFINAETGKATRKPFLTGDLIKGTVSLDPDGYPLLYFGSRDNKLRIVALDRPEVTELWSYDARTAPQPVWDDDWDGNPVILDDYMLEGGENSWFYVFKLNRGYDSQGKVKVAPEKTVEMPGFTPQLFKDLGDRMVAIESSVAVQGNRAFFANSGGLITGVDLTRIAKGAADVFFRFWAGDDIDATLVIDKEGFVYAAAELERFNLRRPFEVGQLIKLNPNQPDKPVVWSIPVPGAGPKVKGGIWATPALDADRGILYVPTHLGHLLAIDTRDGSELWRKHLGSHEWSSPLLIDNQLLVGLCGLGGLRMYDVSNTREPQELWTLKTGACIEATPAVWKGRIYVGSRDGYIYGFGD